MRGWGLRPALRAAVNLWANRACLPGLWRILTTDTIHPATISAARRLLARGHSASAASKLPVFQDGSPAPWYSYPFLDFLADFDCTAWDVLEFGSGQSTLFWSARARRVVAFEHDALWIEKLRPLLPAHAEVRLFEIARIEEELRGLGLQPALVVIDGCKRQACAAAALRVFGKSPFYVLENSDWLPVTAAFMRAEGLREIRFKGFGPINAYAWCTSLMVSEESLPRLAEVSAHCEVPGGLPAADFEARDREMQA